MSTWKKVLLSGADITSGDFAGNKGDLIAGSGIAMTGTLTETLLGAAGDDVTVKVDIVGGTSVALGSGASDDTDVAGGDFLLVADASDSNNIKRTTITDAVAAVSSGVTSLTVTGDSSGQALNTANGGVSLSVTGGEGIDVTASAGALVVKGEDATSGNKGIAKFHSGDFDVSSGEVTIADDAIITALIKDGNVTHDKLAANAVENDNIAASGITGAGKVKFNSLSFSDATDVTAGALTVNDLFIVDNNASGNGSGNKKATLSQLNSLLGESGNIGDIATMHNGVGTANTIGSASTPSINVVTHLVVDANGHVTASDSQDIPSASASAAGIVNTDNGQEFAGNKTFKNNLQVDGTLTVTGNLTIEGTTTTIESTTLTVTDEKITLASLDPDSDPYAVSDVGNTNANTAADLGGIILQSHSGTTESKFAAFTWNKSGNLSGWQVRDTSGYTSDDVDQDTPSADHAVAIMEFGADGNAPGDGVKFGHGLGSFFCTTTGALYFRTA